jgi:cell division protein FtsQ
MLKRIRYIIIWTLVIAYVIVAFGFMAEKQNALVCNHVEVYLTDSLKNRFIEKETILNLLERRGIKLIGRNFNGINLEKVESIINDYPSIQKAEAYKTANGSIVIELKQRNPIIRIIDKRNITFYIDENGYIMRTSGNYTSHVIIANGNIHVNFPVTNATNVKKLQKQFKIFTDLYNLSLYIAKNKFWNAQIQQIYVNAQGDIELIPQVGSHVVVFGDYSDCETKFSNLMSLYKNGLPTKGWNTYETINLKYKGQVICTKRD